MMFKIQYLSFIIPFFALLGLTPLTYAGGENAEGLVFGANPLPEAVVEVTVPPTIQRGNVLDVSVSYPQLEFALDSRCILLLPAPNPPYKETIIFHRKYDVVGASGHACPMYIPDFVQYEGVGVIVAVVDGVGVGVARVEITP